MCASAWDQVKKDFRARIVHKSLASLPLTGVLGIRMGTSPCRWVTPTPRARLMMMVN